MVEAILSLVSGGNSFLALLTAVLGVVAAAYFKGRKAANTDNQAKEAAARARQLKDIADASDARNRVLPNDRVSDDKYRRE